MLMNIADYIFRIASLSFFNRAPAFKIIKFTFEKTNAF